MRIWLINHYAVPTKYYPLARPASFAKYLMRMGHTVTIFAASTVHNSDLNMINDNELFKEDIVEGIHYVYVRDRSYSGNGAGRIINMLLFPMRLSRVSKHFEKPDVILSVSATPMACMKGLKLAKKYKCKGIAEIADLWPESFVAYGMIKASNPLLRFMYAYEKNIYKRADAIIFTMEGGKDYIIEKGWDTAHRGPVDVNKIYHINNGIDLDVYDYNRKYNTIDDPDLNDPNIFKVVYTGSIRKANGIDQLVDVAEALQRIGENNVKFLIYGDGGEKTVLEEKIGLIGLKNIKFKGKIGKDQIPYVLSKADLCLLHWTPTPITKYGMSMNKSFEYLASGRPILSNSVAGYDLIEKYHCGVSKNIDSVSEYAEYILTISKMSDDKRKEFCKNARAAAQDYDFKKLTERLIEVIIGPE